MKRFRENPLKIGFGPERKPEKTQPPLLSIGLYFLIYIAMVIFFVDFRGLTIFNLHPKWLDILRPLSSFLS